MPANEFAQITGSEASQFGHFDKGQIALGCGHVGSGGAPNPLSRRRQSRTNMSLECLTGRQGRRVKLSERWSGASTPLPRARYFAEQTAVVNDNASVTMSGCTYSGYMSDGAEAFTRSPPLDTAVRSTLDRAA
jgi:hypothetical protein